MADYGYKKGNGFGKREAGRTQPHNFSGRTSLGRINARKLTSRHPYDHLDVIVFHRKTSLLHKRSLELSRK